MRKGQALAAVLVLCAVLAGISVGAVLLVSEQGLRAAGWIRRQVNTELAALSALEWARYRLATDPGFLTLASPRVEEVLPERVSEEEVVARYQLENTAGRTLVSGPDVPVPPGLFAALYVMVEDDFSAAGTGEFAPVTAAGLQSDWSAVPSGQVEAPGLFRGDVPGTVSLSVPSFSGPGGTVPVGEAGALSVEVGDPALPGPAVRLSPRVVKVETGREVPFTALAWGSGGAWQAVPPDAVFELEYGPGTLVPEGWGVRYVPAGPGSVALRVTVEVDGQLVMDRVEFEVVVPQRLCRVVPVVGGREAGEAWLRDRGGSAAVLTWQPAR